MMRAAYAILLVSSVVSASKSTGASSPTPPCTDTPDWNTGGDEGEYDCDSYVDNGICNGNLVEGMEEWMGEEYNYPEHNCCACGGGAKPPSPPPPSPPPPSPPLQETSPPPPASPPPALPLDTGDTISTVVRLKAEIEALGVDSGPMTLVLESGQTFNLFESAGGGGWSSDGVRVQSNLTIEGAGATLDAAHQGRMFRVDSLAQLILRNLILVYGLAPAVIGVALATSCGTPVGDVEGPSVSCRVERRSRANGRRDSFLHHAAALYHRPPFPFLPRARRTSLTAAPLSELRRVALCTSSVQLCTL